MRFDSVFCAVSALFLVASATPIEMEKRAPTAKPPYAPQGVALYKCTKKNTVALTFDDGITELADKVIDQLNKAGMKGTFFVNGENYGKLKDHVPTLKRMIKDGHQVGSHTWNHPHLPQLSTANIRSQMTRLENEMFKLINRYPTYMRPPYFEFDAKVLKVMKDLKYRVIIADIDTNDWQQKPDESFKAFRSGLDSKGSIVLAHDVHENTVNKLVPRMISELKRRGLKSVTVGECLGEHPNNWYRYAPR